MELQIKDLVDSIKKDGIDAAKKEAEKIISETQKKADSLIKKAEEKAEKILSDAKKEIDVMKENAKVNAEQAKRDAILSFNKEIEEQYKKILAADTKNAMSGESLYKLIEAALSDKDVSKYVLEVKEVTEDLKAKLAEAVKKGLEIKPVKNIDAGFRLSSKDGSGFFDCTEEEIAKILAPFFNDFNF